MSLLELKCIFSNFSLAALLSLACQTNHTNEVNGKPSVPKYAKFIRFLLYCFHVEPSVSIYVYAFELGFANCLPSRKSVFLC